ncbi:MAG: GNAT family protein [Pseudomonadota bacterium]
MSSTKGQKVLGYSDLFLKPREMEDRDVRLEPVNERHRDGLQNAADDPDIWTYLRINAYGPAFETWFSEATKSLTDPHVSIFAARDRKTDEIVGSTGYLCIDPDNRVAQLGHTWFSKAARGTCVNPASKRLLLEEAFGSGANRVVLRADGRNMRSRAAIEGLGATFEGLLRDHLVLEDGTVRDTACYSILASEWPDIRIRLDNRIAERRAEDDI